MLGTDGFDLWADAYDTDVRASDESGTYPFAGYAVLLRRVFGLVTARGARNVLDLGCGTGALLRHFADTGIEVTGVDFSDTMIRTVRRHLPGAELYLCDLRDGLPAALDGRRFDAITATYSLHHLQTAEKIRLIRDLRSRLTDSGILCIGDIAFGTDAQQEVCRRAAGSDWDDDESYFVFAELAPILPDLTFDPVSFCSAILTCGPRVPVSERLRALADESYADFQAKLTPTIPRESCMGIRVPALRQFAKTFGNEPDCPGFLHNLPHAYYDENMLHSILCSGIRDYDACLASVDAFLPYIDNWAVCDTLSPRVFARHREELLQKIREWISSKHTYTCRFGIGMLMSHYLGDAFSPEYLRLPAAVRSDEYYVNMMTAWYFATALAKQWDATIPYLSEHRLDPWVHARTIRKAVESFRITEEQKRYLRTLK